MANIWKTWIRASYLMRIIIALSYGLSVFGTPLSHTCKLGDKDVHNHHSECTYHQPEGNSCAEVRLISNQISHYDNKDQSPNTYCAACLYSNISKSFKANSTISLVSIETSARVQILPQLNFTKQLECLSSISLRAPPSITS